MASLNSISHKALTDQRYKFVLLTFLAGILYLCLIPLGYAQGSDFNVLNGIDAIYKPVQVEWGGKIKVYAERLFWMLVSLDFAWTGVIYVLEKQDLGEILVSFSKKILTIGFFFALLKFCDTWIPAIIDSFRIIGTSVGGSGDTTPDGIAITGFELAQAAFKGMDKLGALDKMAVIFPITVVAIIMFLAFLFVAVQLLVTLIESYLAIGAGVMLLGFGGSRWTTDMATKYLQYAVSTGLKLMLLYLVVGLGQTIADSLVIESNDLLNSCLRAMGVGLFYAYLAIQIPAIASAMISGSPSLTAGGLAGAALTLGAAVAGGAAATMGAGKGGAAALTGGAAGATGLSQALSAGLNSAADFGKSGMDAAAHATGQVVGQGLGMATSGIGSALSGGTSFGEKVGNSAGGQIAQQIENSRGGSMSGASASQPGAPSGSANSSSGSPQATSANAGSDSGSGASGGSPSASSGSGGDSSSSTSSSSSAPSGSAPIGGGNSGATDIGTSVMPTGSTGMGDASTASLSGSGQTPSAPGANTAAGNKPPSTSMSEKIQSLQGYVPQDQAGASGFNLQSAHTQD